MADIAPCNELCPAANVAGLFFQHVFRLHGLPDDVVTNRDPYFRSALWQLVLQARVRRNSFLIGESVGLLRRNIVSSRRSEKLDHHNLDQFRNSEQINHGTYRLELPPDPSRDSWHLREYNAVVNALRPVFGEEVQETDADFAQPHFKQANRTAAAYLAELRLLAATSRYDDYAKGVSIPAAQPEAPVFRGDQRGRERRRERGLYKRQASVAPQRLPYEPTTPAYNPRNDVATFDVAADCRGRISNAKLAPPPR
ncbi:hypothetical protein RI367_008383 [Sorochytrium milnesiophthora]